MLDKDKLENLILQYQTEQCSKDQCLKDFYFSSVSLCHQYHGQEDQRRPIAVLKTNCYNYSNIYFRDEFKPNFPHCLNSYEYHYHPLNFKQKMCKATTDCQNIQLCHFFHSNEEKQLANKIIQNLFSAYFPPTQESSKKKQLRPCSEYNIVEIKSPSEMKSKQHSTLFDEDENNKWNPQSYVQSLNRQNEIQEPLENTFCDYYQEDLQEEKRINMRGAQTNFTLMKPEQQRFYIQNEQVNFYEDISHEFQLGNTEFDMINQYISGFLNSQGGILYIGINDNGFVKGVSFNNHKLEKFTQSFQDNLKEFYPQITSSDVHIYFVPVQMKGQESKIQRKYVIEIQIFKSQREVIYYTPDGKCYQRQSASTIILTPSQFLTIFSDNFNRIYQNKRKLYNSIFIQNQFKILENLQNSDLNELKEKIEKAKREIEKKLKDDKK